MRSAAYAEWLGGRASRIQRLFDAHKAVEGAGARGRRWKTEQINWALVLLLAAEFQGYARDLHDEAADVFALAAAQGNATLETILKARTTQNRELDRGNANPGNLGKDFRLLGLDLWADLDAASPGMKPKWNANLASLNEARNAIAHSHSGKIQALDLKLSVIRKWRSSLDGLTAKMDDVVTAHLDDLFTIGNPWTRKGGTP